MRGWRYTSTASSQRARAATGAAAPSLEGDASRSGVRRSTTILVLHNVGPAREAGKRAEDYFTGIREGTRGRHTDWTTGAAEGADRPLRLTLQAPGRYVGALVDVHARPQQAHRVRHGTLERVPADDGAGPAPVPD